MVVADASSSSLYIELEESILLVKGIDAIIPNFALEGTSDMLVLGSRVLEENIGTPRG